MKVFEVEMGSIAIVEARDDVETELDSPIITNMNELKQGHS